MIKQINYCSSVCYNLQHVVILISHGMVSGYNIVLGACALALGWCLCSLGAFGFCLS